MGHQQQVQSSSQERVNAYLERFKSEEYKLKGADPDGESALDQFLLERAAEELRAAQARPDKLAASD